MMFMCPVVETLVRVTSVGKRPRDSSTHKGDVVIPRCGGVEPNLLVVEINRRRQLPGTNQKALFTPRKPNQASVA